MINAREKNLRGIGNIWVRNLVIFVRVTKESLNGRWQVRPGRGRGISLVKRKQEVQWPEAEACLAHSQIAARPVQRGQGEQG